MLLELPIFTQIKLWYRRLTPGTRGFLQNMSIISICFAFSKIFSSIATIIMARYLGRELFGEISVVLLVSQVVSPLMLLGLHMSVMRYGANKENPARWIATAFYLSAFTTTIILLTVWILKTFLTSWVGISNEKLVWAMLLATLMSFYLLYTHFYQTLNRFKERGLVEVLLGFMLLPGLALGYWFYSRSFEMALAAYVIAYSVCLAPMVVKFFKHLSPGNLFAPDTGQMLKYGGFACFSGIGFLLIFVIQPLQLNHYTNEAQVGVFRLYSACSLILATFAASIFHTVFFPKVAASKNRREIGRIMTVTWIRTGLPIMAMFAIVFSIGVWSSGPAYPLTLKYVFLFSAASVLITVQTTYGQLIAAQGIAGMRWVLAISIASGAFNVILSMVLIPYWEITGAIVTLIITFVISLAAMLFLRKRMFE